MGPSVDHPTRTVSSRHELVAAANRCIDETFSIQVSHFSAASQCTALCPPQSVLSRRTAISQPSVSARVALSVHSLTGLDQAPDPPLVYKGQADANQGGSRPKGQTRKLVRRRRHCNVSSGRLLWSLVLHRLGWSRIASALARERYPETMGTICPGKLHGTEFAQLHRDEPFSPGRSCFSAVQTDQHYLGGLCSFNVRCSALATSLRAFRSATL